MHEEFEAALAHHVLTRAIEESPDDIPARFTELWKEYQTAAARMLNRPELAAARISRAVKRDNNQAEI